MPPYATLGSTQKRIGPSTTVSTPESVSSQPSGFSIVTS